MPVDLTAIPAPDPADEAVEAALAFNRAVADETRVLRIRKAAQDRFRAEQEPEQPPFDAGTLVELLGRPADPPMRAEGLIPSDAGTLVVAQRKTGKTTLELNYARSLLTGEDFLGRFPVRPITGTVALLNYEVSGNMIARWADDVGVPRERLYVVNLRGRRNPLTHPGDRQRLAEDLRARDTHAPGRGSVRARLRRRVPERLRRGRRVPGRPGRVRPRRGRCERPHAVRARRLER